VGTQTLDALHAVDATIGRLLKGLETRNLSDIIHVIIVSDHGMSESDNSRLIYYDDILDNKALDNIWKIEGWPLLGIRPYPGRGEEATTEIYKQFYNGSLQPDAKYEVFLRSNMPQKYHFSNSERISPVIAIPRDGWNFVTRKQFSDPTKVYEPRGVHGYDNFGRQSRAIFVAKGPLFDWDFVRGSKLKPFGNIEVYSVLSRILGLSPAPNNGTLNGHLKALEL
jgi:predicted AlkP superfamily pyrophosphatase or phosphodiesterase